MDAADTVNVDPLIARHRKERHMTTQSIALATGIRWKSGDLRAGVIVLTATIVVALHRGFGTMESVSRVVSGLTQHQAVQYMFVGALLLLGIVPLIVARFYLKEPLSALGVQWGDWRFGLKAVGILMPVIAVTLLWPGASNPEMRAWFPLDHSAGASVGTFVVYQTVRFVVFYTAWEFLFRGFMLFGLRNTTGDCLAICIQVIPSCLWHIGMPVPELLSSIAGGVLFGMLALRTRSIVWPLLLHTMIGVVNDGLIVWL